MIDGMFLYGAGFGHDLAGLTPHDDETFAPPYAARGVPDWTRPVGEVEGWGCDAEPRVRREVRAVEDMRPTHYQGLEISFLGRVCKGDSGGALWQDGKLVGILTGVDDPYGFATHID